MIETYHEKVRSAQAVKVSWANWPDICQLLADQLLDGVAYGYAVDKNDDEDTPTARFGMNTVLAVVVADEHGNTDIAWDGEWIVRYDDGVVKMEPNEFDDTFAPRPAVKPPALPPYFPQPSVPTVPWINPVPNGPIRIGDPPYTPQPRTWPNVGTITVNEHA